jgi:hypothetical protein
MAKQFWKSWLRRVLQGQPAAPASRRRRQCTPVTVAELCESRVLLSAHGLGAMARGRAGLENHPDVAFSHATASSSSTSATGDAGGCNQSGSSSSSGSSNSDGTNDSSGSTSTTGEHLVFLFGSHTVSTSGHNCDNDSARSDCGSSSSSGSTSSSSTSGTTSTTGTDSSSGSSSSTTETGTAGQALPSFQVAVENQSGGVVKSDSSSTVTLTIASGPTGAVVDSNSTMTATVKNGVATFNNVILDTAGIYTLSATDSNTGVTSAVSGTVTVNAAAATQLLVQAVTTPGTVGQAITPAVTVTAEDAFGNVATNDNDSVTLNLASGAAGNFTSGSTTAVQAQNGVATFDNVALDTATPLPAGTNPYFLFATQGTLTSSNSNAIEILSA